MGLSTVFILVSIIIYLYLKYKESIKWAENIPGHEEPLHKAPALRALFSSRRSMFLIIHYI